MSVLEERPAEAMERAESPRVSVVVPARNEAANLPHVIAEIGAEVDEIIVVDGHSTDGTAELAPRLDPRVRLVRQRGRGKGDALAHGFAAATGDILVMLDADCSADPREIPRFLQALTEDGADFAKGTRNHPHGGSADITPLRSLGNRALTAQVNLLFGTAYSDLCYGYNAFWTHCLPHIDVDCDGFEVETQINIRIAKSGLTVAEVPSFEHERLHGESNLNTWRDGWRVQRTIARELLRRAPATRRAPRFHAVEEAAEA